MTNNHSSGRAIRTIIVILCIINIAFLAIASRRGTIRARSAQNDRSGAETAATAGTAAEYAPTQEAAGETAAADTSEPDRRTENQTADGPVITLSDSLPDLTQDDLDDLVPVLKQADAISAEDGNGKDITDDIEAAATADLDDLGHFTVRFTVTTDDDKTAEATADVTVPITKPILELTDYNIDLDRNAGFQSLDYVETSVDEDGSDLSHYIRVNGDVDTSREGTYDVTYTIQSAINNASAEKTLQVTVQ